MIFCFFHFKHEKTYRKINPSKTIVGDNGELVKMSKFVYFLPSRLIEFFCLRNDDSTG